MKKELTRFLEVRTESDELIFRLKLIVMDGHDPGQSKESKAEKGNGGNGESANSVNHPPMTDAQKRYLFRLLADQGIEKEAAHMELKRTFGVDNLKIVTRLEASREIERMLATQKGGVSNARA